MTPIVDELKKEYGREINIVYVSIDRTDGKNRAREYGIIGTPTFILLNKEGEVTNQLKGSFPKAALERVIKELVAES